MTRPRQRLNDITAAIGARALRTRWLVRAPIGLYRIGLGCLFGTRLLMLEHIGRVSGERRYVILEVVDRPTRDEYVIVSGFGTTSQWYRNVLANPAVRLSCGLRRLATATARPMTDREAADTLRGYAEQHPKAWANLRSTIEAAVGHQVSDLPMVSLTLR
jgi:deazaflavin-dependent oxidoreductase (nitroreductase family)